MMLRSTILHLAFLALSFSIAASPIDPTPADCPPSSSSYPPKQECPSQATIDAYFGAYSDVGYHTVFYSGVKDYKGVVAPFASEIGGKWYESAVNMTLLEIWRAECTEDERNDRVLDKRVSAALAKLATGTTYVVLGSEQIWNGSIWITTEWPLLKYVKYGIDIIAVNGANTTQRQPYVAHNNPWAKPI